MASQETALEGRIKTLEKHVLWLSDKTKNSNDKTRENWYWAFFVTFLLTVGLFVWLTAVNGMHDHFLTMGYKDDDEFISVYDKPITSAGNYALALVLGVTVAFTEKIVMKPGERVIHGLLVDKKVTTKEFGTIFFYETACVVLGTITTFLYFTNVAILLCVLFGRLLGALIVYRFFYPPKPGSGGGETTVSKVASLAF